ncbi:hypothetical protein GCM10011391_30270 [Pullulanibacillus camelliae]|uniref:Uncharacterized protein n=1 Tax=Pullulanibacillus camelliae TaxID=1707096 RepID=A0A8J2YKJ4_9BACL|nr:hypothetical protein GCM10011391_30270 [Pullulanibacillus camelliae]
MVILVRKLDLHHFAGTPDVIFANHTLRLPASLRWRTKVKVTLILSSFMSVSEVINSDSKK